MSSLLIRNCDKIMNASKEEKIKSNDCKLSFEEALAQLDEVVEALESGKLTLSKSTSLYEKGMKLARVCNEMLAAAELKVSQIETEYDEKTGIPTKNFTETEFEN